MHNSCKLAKTGQIHCVSTRFGRICRRKQQYGSGLALLPGPVAEVGSTTTTGHGETGEPPTDGPRSRVAARPRGIMGPGLVAAAMTDTFLGKECIELFGSRS